MPELWQFLVGCALLWVIGYAAYIAGRDGAERHAFATISSLRQEIRAERLENNRLRERLNTIPRGDGNRARFGEWMGA